MATLNVTCGRCWRRGAACGDSVEGDELQLQGLQPTYPLRHPLYLLHPPPLTKYPTLHPRHPPYPFPTSRPTSPPHHPLTRPPSLPLYPLPPSLSFLPFSFSSLYSSSLPPYPPSLPPSISTYFSQHIYLFKALAIYLPSSLPSLPPPLPYLPPLPPFLLPYLPFSSSSFPPYLPPPPPPPYLPSSLPPPFLLPSLPSSPSLPISQLFTLGFSPKAGGHAS